MKDGHARCVRAESWIKFTEKKQNKGEDYTFYAATVGVLEENNSCCHSQKKKSMHNKYEITLKKHGITADSKKKKEEKRQTIQMPDTNVGLY